MFGAWLTDVYERARDTWDFDDDTLCEIARAGVEASFADDATKRAIHAGIDGWVATPAA
jgi:adenosine deaminase